MRIRINNEFLELPDDSIRYEKVSDFFEFSQSNNDFSFPYVIEGTDTNHRLLGFINHSDVANKKFLIPCHIDFEDIKTFNATILINSYSNKRYNITIKTGVYSLTNVDKLIKELDLGADITLGADQAAIIDSLELINATENWEDYGFCFPPFKAPNLYQDTGNTSFVGIANMVNANTGRTCYNTSLTGNIYSIVPWFYLFWVLDKIATAESLILSGDFITNSEIKKLLLTNLYNLDAPIADNQSLVRVYSSKLYDGVTDRIEFKKGIPNTYDNSSAWNNTLFEYEFLEEGVFVITSEIHYTKTYFEAIGTVTLKVSGVGTIASESIDIYGEGGVVVITDTYTVTSGDVGRKVYMELHNPPISNGEIYVNSGSFFYIENLSLTGLNIYSNTIKPANHMPELTVSELLIKIKKQFNLTWEIDKTEGTFVIDFADPVLSESEMIDITEDVSPDFETQIINVGSNFHLKFEPVAEELKDFDASKIIGYYRLLSLLPTPYSSGQLAVVLATNKVYIAVSNGTTLVWEEHTNLFNGYKTGATEIEEIVLEFNPVEMCYSHNTDGSSDVPAIMPYLNEKGSGNMFGLGNTEYTSRLVFLRGLNNASGAEIGGQYLLASSGCYTINGYGCGKLSLVIYSSFGLKEKFFANSLNILRNQEVTERTIYLTAPKLLAISKKKRYLIQNIPYIFKSISIPLGKRLGPGLIKLIKL